jgi:hypothetical protein
MTDEEDPPSAGAVDRDLEMRRLLARAMRDVVAGKARIVVVPPKPKLPRRPTGG